VLEFYEQHNFQKMIELYEQRELSKFLKEENKELGGKFSELKGKS
jgi:hypothetical protein